MTMPKNYLLCSQRVDDGGLANIGIPHKPDRDVLLVGAQARQLSQQAQQTALAKGVGDAGMESQGGKLLAEVAQPALCHPGRNLQRTVLLRKPL